MLDADCNSVPAFFIAYLEAYINFRQHGGQSIDTVRSLVWQQVLVGYGLVSATTPYLKGFLARFKTDGMQGATNYSSDTRTYGYGKNSRPNTNHDTYVMASLDRKDSQKRPPPPPVVEPAPVLPGRPGDPMHTATAYAADPLGESGDGSLKSFGSDRMMIHRKVEYDVSSS